MVSIILHKLKFTISGLLVAGLLLSSTSLQGESNAAAQAGPIQVLVNEKPVTMPVAPKVRDGVTLVPFRALFEALGFNVSFHPENQTITGVSSTVNLTLQIGSKTAQVNGQQQPLLAAPALENENTLVPLRFVAESTGRNVMMVGSTIYIRNRSYLYNFSNFKDRNDLPNFTNGNQLADYVGEDVLGNVYFYWKVRSGNQDKLFVSILNNERQWTIRQRLVTTIEHWDNAYMFDWVQGNVYLTRDTAGLRYFELNPDGTIRQDRYLDQQAVADPSKVYETTAPVYLPDGNRGILYQKDGKALVYKFNDLDHPIVIPKRLTNAQLWVLDEAQGTLLNIFNREINVYDLKGNPVYNKDGKKIKLMVNVPKDGKVSHIVYRGGKIYYAFQINFHHIDIVSAQITTERQATYTTASLKQEYEYYMALTVANNSKSWADIVGDQLHIYCNMYYGGDTAMEIDVMEMDPA
ncbi:stalk domain-containing protein [Paenibacillus curdlanolyticus]|uniref:stalk domain-containing protein n=1 Tax=Paenibacillus curdlanolyticus TaxID=59840 RepID=UPI00068238CF|nr:copper amine oxidase N-terminal domain-containing protein [Paenibacillus curdlanolyticus]